MTYDTLNIVRQRNSNMTIYQNGLASLTKRCNNSHITNKKQITHYSQVRNPTNTQKKQNIETLPLNKLEAQERRVGLTQKSVTLVVISPKNFVQPGLNLFSR